MATMVNGTESFQKKPPSTGGRREDGLGSVFKFRTKDGAIAYRYDIDMQKIKGGDCEVKKPLLVSTLDDGHKAALNRITGHLMDTTQGLSGNFGTDGKLGVVYDSRKALFTSKKLPVKPKGLVQIVPDDLMPEIRRELADFDRIDVTITPAGTVDLTDTSQYVSGAAAGTEDRSLRQFLDLLVSQCAVKSGNYTAIGSGKLFLNEGPFERVGNGMILRSGVAKGVRMVEEDGGATPALVIDVKTSAFFASQRLATTIREIMNGEICPAEHPQWRDVKRLLRDVRVYVTKRPDVSFRIRGFTTEAAQQMVIATTGRAVPCPLHLKYPEAPAVVPDTPWPSGGREVYYALEELTILPDQRVPLPKISEHLTSMLLTANSAGPKDRYELIRRHCTEFMAIFGHGNPLMRAFGVRIDETSNVASWRTPRSRYLVTMQSTIVWAVLCAPRHMKDVQPFVQQYLKLAREKDMKFAEPEYVSFDSRREEDFEALFPQLAENGVHFAMLVDPRDVPSHDLLKFHERTDQVITQHVTLEKARDIVNKHQTQTLTNLINKSNCKLFGLNYMPILQNLPDHYRLENGVFVLGYDVNHPPQATREEQARLRRKNIQANSFDPSVVGICANAADVADAFVGDFFYQESRREQVDDELLTRKTCEALTLLEKNRPHHAAPQLIVIVRDGVSEGQFRMAVDRELPAIKAGCERYRPGYCPKFVFVVSNKHHSKKFFRVADGGRLENPLPGTVVDRGAVRPDLDEFFMQAHKPLKGTSKFVEFSVLVNEVDMSLDEAEEFLYGLCFNHQIVNRAISIPEPVYQADELAKRGRNVLRQMKSSNPAAIPKTEDGLVDYRKLSALVAYNETWMAPTRFNA
ncbi:piwi domain-containing protein [Aphelenchoides avenae]|nr:piwi domain-containing protein [Aphelenchus avenae]